MPHTREPQPWRPWRGNTGSLEGSPPTAARRGRESRDPASSLGEAALEGGLPRATMGAKSSLSPAWVEHVLLSPANCSSTLGTSTFGPPACSGRQPG